ncbi:energy transducer TonB [Aquimarina brevivitae]|uniref:Protein TonB n=1 Tax=Aquimarina brevivitae TaxID=323412 RepID=A0A4Q7PG63_9FLAO|nr:energy transducer TonB [Aquimarina brevivitae]RZS98858.1 protein TonB [Aquimarina brevivitae]
MSNKHDANVRKSTVVNFQIGLIASLLFTYVMFEVYTSAPVTVSPPEPEPVEEEYSWNEVFMVEKEPKKQAVVEKPKRPKEQPQEFKQIDDDKEIASFEKEFENKTTKAPANSGVKTSDIEDLKEEEEIGPIPFIGVESVPIFPGCEGLSTNEEKASCFSQKIKRLVSKKFDTSLAGDLGLSGLQRIYVQFEVYKDGTIRNIKARSTHPLLEKEAIRVVQKFPAMTPGKQRDRNVTVKYQLPIIFQIQ